MLRTATYEEEKISSKKCYIDSNNQLCVENDNALIKNNETTTEIKGTYTIESSDVLKLLAILNDAVIKQELWEVNYRHYTYKGKIINDLTEELKEIIFKNNFLSDENKSLDKEIEKLEKEIFNLKSKLNKFNNSRRFWERKFNIND
jgi:predicted RNase H-like nuclease (RuvC/YqgF family)